MSHGESTEIAKVARPPPHVWKGTVAQGFVKLAKVSCGLGAIASVATFYYMVMKKKALIDAYEAKNLTPEAQKKKFDNMNKLKVFTCTQPDKYSWN